MQTQLRSSLAAQKDLLHFMDMLQKAALHADF